MKDRLGRAAIECIADNIVRVMPAFDRRGFVRTATRDFAALELKARVFATIEALAAYLPSEPADAIGVLVAAGQGWTQGDGVELDFAAWPVIDFVGEKGLGCFDVSMEALRALTHLFTAEFAIRPFITARPKAALKYLRRWVKDPSAPVRRLVSEGTRPRLPWAPKLTVFEDDPSPVLALLTRLRDDPAETVRRSVANHLNDLSKSHPSLVFETCRSWLDGASEERRWIVRHALRTRVKAKDPEALAILGFDPSAKVEVQGLKLSKKRLRLGEDLAFAFVVQSRAKTPQPLVIDYAVHHQKADGSMRPKVFKLQTVTLAPGDEVAVTKTHRLRPITTRKYYSGRHAVEILINGQSQGTAEFELRVES